MKRLLGILVLLAVCLNSFAVNLYIHAPDLGANPATNRTVVIQQLSPFLGNNQFYTTDTNGDLTITNIAVAAPFNATIKAPPAAITFQFYVTSDANGTVNVTNYTSVVGIATYPAGQTAPSIQMADSRYARSGISLSNSFYLNSNPSNYFSGLQVSNTAAQYATNAAQTVYSNNASGYLSSIPTGATNQFLTAIPVAATNQFLTSIPTGATNQFVTRTALAGSNYLTSVPTGATNLFITGTVATNSFDPLNAATNVLTSLLSSNYVTAAITNGVIFNNRLLLASNGIVALIPSTNGFITAGNIPVAATNQFATTNYVNSATNGFISDVPVAATNLFVLTNDTTWFASKAITNRTAQQVILNNNAITNGYFTNLTGIAPVGNWLAIGTNGFGGTGTNLTAQQIAIISSAITNTQNGVSITGILTGTIFANAGNVVTNWGNLTGFDTSGKSPVANSSANTNFGLGQGLLLISASGSYNSNRMTLLTPNSFVIYGMKNDGSAGGFPNGDYAELFVNNGGSIGGVQPKVQLKGDNSFINCLLSDGLTTYFHVDTNGIQDFYGTLPPSTLLLTNYSTFNGVFIGDGSAVTNIQATNILGLGASYIPTLNGRGTNTTLTNASINNSIQRWNTNYYGAYSNSVYLGATNIEVLKNGAISGAIRFPNGDTIQEFATGAGAGTDTGIAMGLNNSAPLYENFTAIIGGATNDVAAVNGFNISGASIFGGANNKINYYGDYSTIVGGSGNITYGSYASILGGVNNIMVANATPANIYYNTILGGVSNMVGSASSAVNGGYALGAYAHAAHSGSFVWNGYNQSAFTFFRSTGTNQFLVNAIGGVGINTNNPNGNALNVSGTVNANGVSINGVGVWTTNSLIPAYLATNVVTGLYITNAYYFGGLATNVNGIGITNLCFTNLNQNGLAQVTNLINSLYATNILPTSNSLLTTMSSYIQTATNQFKPTVTNVVTSFLTGITTNLQFGYGTTTTNTFYITNGLIMRISQP